MPHHSLPAAALALALTALAASVSAQIQQRPAPAAPEATGTSQKSQAEAVVSDVYGASYGVRFGDELLSAIAEDGTIPRIVVRPVRGFGQLNRPRVSFVRELAKSVEAI